jgi:hypothetical protein
MSDTADLRSALSAIEADMHRMVAGGAVPYDCARNIWSTAMSVTTSPEVMHPMWLIWGALTDWVENRPEEIRQAECAMLRAANEWLAIDRDDHVQRKAYLDRWVFDEMGYERKEN